MLNNRRRKCKAVTRTRSTIMYGWYAASLTICVHSAEAQCTSSWSADYGLPAGANVHAVTTFDFDGDGSDPARLVIAGDVTTTDGTIGARVAWTDGTLWHAFGGTITGGSAVAVTFHDFDGAGSQPAFPVVGGTFTSIGGVAANRVARWNGTAWEPLGAGFNDALNVTVRALASLDADGVGPSPPVLYAGGLFQQSGTTIVSNVARWDGASWQPMGAGVVAATSGVMGVECFELFDLDGIPQTPQRLVVGGGFQQGGTNNILGWNGSAWVSMGSLGNAVTGLTTIDHDGAGPAMPSLVAATYDGDASLKVWNGSQWDVYAHTELTFGVAAAIQAADVDGPGADGASVFACGNFDTPVRTLARWGVGGWLPVGPQASTVTLAIDDMTAWDSDGEGPLAERLVVGGVSFASGPGVPSVGGLGLWDGSTWSTTGTGFVSSNRVVSVYGLELFDLDGAQGPLPLSLIAAGGFRSAAGVVLGGVARWDGAAWRPIGAGLEGTALESMEWDRDGPGPMEPELFVVETTSTQTRIMRWDGGSWQLFANSPATGSFSIDCITAWDSDGVGPLPEQLHAGGQFSSGALARVARWDGTSWQPLASGFNGRVRTLKVIAGAGPSGTVLVAGGDFSLAGATGVPRIAQWNGTSWSSFGSGLSSSVYDVATYDPDGAGPAVPQLIAGGTFGAATPSGVARWTGTTWTQLGAGLKQIGIDGGVESLSIFDPDGPGPAIPLLIAGGRFTHSGTVVAPGIASWNGTAWSPMATAIDSSYNLASSVRDTQAMDPDGPGPLPTQLVVAGLFSSISGVPAASVIRWQPSVSPRIVSSPSSATVCGPEVQLTMFAEAYPTPAYRWRRGSVDLFDGPTPSGSIITGAATSSLSIANLTPADSGLYDCVASNSCAIATSASAILTVLPASDPECSPSCDGDVNCDFALDGFDVEVQEKAVGGDITDYCQPDPDFNGDFALDGFDVEAVELVVGGGPCP